MKMFCEKEFGIEYKAEVSNMGTPRNKLKLVKLPIKAYFHCRGG